MPSLVGALELMSAVVETGSFVHAGERVGLTQSGVSRAIARLEQQVGVRLFDRNARAVTLTDEGRRFHGHVGPLLAQLNDAIDDADRSAQRVRGRLRVNVDAFFARYILAPRLGEFLAQYPELDVEIISDSITSYTGNLIADGFDAAVAFGDPRPSSLVARKLLETRIITCASPAYLAKHGHPRTPKDLAGDHESILFVDPRSGRPFEWDFRQGKKLVANVPVHGRLVANDVAVALGACLAGHGIAQLMELGTAEYIRAGKLVPLFPRWTDEMFPVYAFHPSRHLPPAKVRAFLDFAVASAKQSS